MGIDPTASAGEGPAGSGLSSKSDWDGLSDTRGTDTDKIPYPIIHPLRPPLHVSEMRTFQRCPREWQIAYVSRRVPRETPEYFTIGREVHRWLEEWWGNEAPELPRDPIARSCCIAYDAHWGAPPAGVTAVEKPFAVEIEGTACAGTVDAIIDDGDVLVVVEHKTTSEDISPGSNFWKRAVHCDPQVSMYLTKYPEAHVLYDVIRKPALRKLRAGKPNEETDDEFVARCVEAMATEPQKYFARFTIVRLDAELNEFAQDVAMIDFLRMSDVQPRNLSACFDRGRKCGYFDVCHGGARLSDDSLFRDQDDDR